MKPHIFMSIVHRGKWACVLARPTHPHAARRVAPVPSASVSYGATPRDAYERWLVQQAMNCVELTVENLT